MSFKNAHPFCYYVPIQDVNEFSFILKSSNLGIGVFATHDIPEHTRITALFPDGFLISRRKRSEIPNAFIDYCIARDKDLYDCPRRFNQMEVGWYLNHSNSPNLRFDSEAHYTIRDIKAGEEMLIDYNDLNEPEDKKKSYYQNH